MAFTCEECKKDFNSEEAYNQHMNDKHGMKKGPSKRELQEIGQKKVEEEKSGLYKKRERSSKLKKAALVVIILLILGAIGFVLATNTSVKVTYVPLTEDGDQVIGNASSSVDFVEFSDFQCPACKAAEPTVKSLIEQYGDRVKFVYKHFPLTNIHPNAQKAAEASECAADQGKFWEFHDILFEKQDALGVGSLKKYAADFGLDAEAFNACLDSGAMAQRVRKDLDEAKSKALRGTPSFLVNGKLVTGVTELNLKTAIEAALRDVNATG